MTTAHWLYLMAIAVWTALLLCFSLSSRGDSPIYQWTRRIFWAIAALQLGQSMNWLGVNIANLAVSSCLGMPGYLALCVLSLIE